MKLRNAIKLAAVGAVAVAVMPAVVLADPDPTLTGGANGVEGAWTINGNGVYTLSCPTGMTCSAVEVEGDGLVQRMVEDGAGNTYIQTIVAEGVGSFGNYAGTDFFGDESWVKMGGGGGLAGFQSVDNTDSGALVGTDVFNVTTVINTGDFMPMMMANTAEAAGMVGTITEVQAHRSMIEIDQSINNTAAEFSDTFGFDHGMQMMMMDDVDGDGTMEMLKGKYAIVTLNSEVGDPNDGAPLGAIAAGNDGFYSGFSKDIVEYENVMAITDAGTDTATMTELAAFGESISGSRMTIIGDIADSYDGLELVGGTGAITAGTGNEDFSQDLMVQEVTGVFYDAGSVVTLANGTTVTGDAGESLKVTTIDQILTDVGTFGFVEVMGDGMMQDDMSFLDDTFNAGNGGADLPGTTTASTETGIIASITGASGFSAFNDYDDTWAYVVTAPDSTTSVY